MTRGTVTTTSARHPFLACLAAGAILVALSGCGKPAQGAASAPGGDSAPLCDFVGGTENAKVHVDAYFPGRHEDTLAAVKTLLTTFPGQIHLEIVDWRTPEGLKRRDATGLTCAGILVNGKNAFDLVTDGKPNKVLFTRCIDGEWTKADLEAAIRQELAAAAGKAGGK